MYESDASFDESDKTFLVKTAGKISVKVNGHFTLMWELK